MDESSDQIRAHFKEDAAAWQSEVDKAMTLGLSKPQLVDLFDNFSVKLKDMERKLSSMSIGLAAYDMKNCVVDLKKMEQHLAAERAKALPPKKFGFKGRVRGEKKMVKEPKMAAAGESNDVRSVVESATVEQPGLRSLAGEVVVLEAKDAEGCDFVLSGLSKCVVIIPSSSTALQLSSLRECVVMAGPSAGSVFIEDCSKCQLYIACHQLRVHSTFDSDIYLHVTSNPIIEDCDGLHFGEYNYSYSNVDSDFDKASLDRSRNFWDKVNDFKWLKAHTKSPHWNIIDRSSILLPSCAAKKIFPDKEF
eukprot:Nk52_evm19s222 gene=Nk52_evmTU19s222